MEENRWIIENFAKVAVNYTLLNAGIYSAQVEMIRGGLWKILTLDMGKNYRQTHKMDYMLFASVIKSIFWEKSFTKNSKM